MSELLSVRIRAHAVKLGLTHLAESVQTTLAHAEADQCSYLQLLDLILDEEVGQREGRRFRNALNLSGLPHRKTLDDFDFAFQPDLDPRKIRGLASLTFVEDNSNVVFLGPPGVGKTMLAVALAVAACPGRLLDLLHPPSMT